MLFNSLKFAIFFPIVYMAYLALPHRWQNRMLLIASYVFYASWDWRFLFLILMSTGVDYFAGRRMVDTRSTGRRKLLLILSLVTNLGLLGVFKYFDFFADSLSEMLTLFGMRADRVTLDLVLPVGISFYTFQTLSYTIDVYRGRLEAERNLVDFALFVAFFPQLVAGPIERASRLQPQIRTPRLITRERVLSGLWMVAWGFFLKVFMADNLAPLVERAFGSQEPVTGVSAWLAIYAFAFQILGDFAGYSFIAMGLASLLGIQLTTNFLFPYFVTNPRDFWRNWHITLSSWLRDYLYVPLGGNRGSNYFIARNLMITMLLGGLWHGAAWVFVLWGLYQGVLLAAHRASDALGITGGEARRYPFMQGIKVILMFQLICFGWLIFRANSVEQVLELFQAMFGSMALPTLEEWRVLTQLGFFSGIVLLVQWMQSRSGDVTSMGGIPGSARVPLVIVMFYALLAWGNFGGGEFIYFQF